MVALKEAGCTALADFRLSQFPSWSGPAESEVCSLLRAKTGTLIGVDQLLETTYITLEIVTFALFLVLTSLILLI